MIVEEKSRINKAFHRIVLYSVKIVPMLISGIYLLNTVFSYFGIDWEGFTYIIQALFITGLYMLSYAFKFCSYHRMFIHYILITLILNIIDYHYGIPLSNRNLFLMYGIITCVFLFLILYLKFKVCRNR